MSKICIILGTRPEIIKLSPIIRHLQESNSDFFIVHSNQHYSQNMDKVFFDELELPQPKYNLEIGSCTHGQMTGRMIEKIESILFDEKPNWVIVQGDTNTVMAGALAASKIGVKIVHVEAGLRSYDRNMPEEINRIVTDSISDALFCPTNKQKNILINEGIPESKIFVTGNTIVDAVYQSVKLVDKNDRLKKYSRQKYFLLTMHRPSNVDNKENLLEIFSALEIISKQNNTKLIFPIHPRTKKQLDVFDIQLNSKYFEIIEPVGYLEMLALEKNAQLIFTDSGGIQEEACILQIPTLTLRENTERPETIDVGASILVGHNKQKIIESFDVMINKNKNWQNPFGNGKSSLKIIKQIS